MEQEDEAGVQEDSREGIWGSVSRSSKLGSKSVEEGKVREARVQEGPLVNGRASSHPVGRMRGLGAETGVQDGSGGVRKGQQGPRRSKFRMRVVKGGSWRETRVQ